MIVPYDSMATIINDNEQPIELGSPANINFIAYPNPTKENINIAFALPANAGTDEMQVFNIVGQQMESRLISQQKGVETFSVSKYQNGCYIAKMKQHPDLWVKFNVLNNF